MFVNLILRVTKQFNRLGTKAGHLSSYSWRHIIVVTLRRLILTTIWSGSLRAVVALMNHVTLPQRNTKPGKVTFARHVVSTSYGLGSWLPFNSPVVIITQIPPHHIWSKWNVRTADYGRLRENQFSFRGETFVFSLRWPLRGFDREMFQGMFVREWKGGGGTVFVMCLGVTLGQACLFSLFVCSCE